MNLPLRLGCCFNRATGLLAFNVTHPFLPPALVLLRFSCWRQMRNHHQNRLRTLISLSTRNNSTVILSCEPESLLSFYAFFSSIANEIKIIRFTYVILRQKNTEVIKSRYALHIHKKSASLAFS